MKRERSGSYILDHRSKRRLTKDMICEMGLCRGWLDQVDGHNIWRESSTGVCSICRGSIEDIDSTQNKDSTYSKDSTQNKESIDSTQNKESIDSTQSNDSIDSTQSNDSTYTRDAVIRIYTGKACSDNGKLNGIGVCFEHHQLNNISEKLPVSNQTNNRTEIYSVIRALEELIAQNKQDNPIVIYSNSLYLVSTMDLNWKKNVNTDLWIRLSKLTKQFTQLELKHIQRQSNCIGNAIANILAKLALK